MNHRKNISELCPSELLLLAIEDCKKIERGEVTFKGKRVVLDMSFWLVNRPGENSCTACMAGAVMLHAPELGVRNRRVVGSEIRPSHFTYKFGRQLNVINYLRTGHISEAFMEAGLEHWTTEVKELSSFWQNQYLENSGDVRAGNEGSMPWLMYEEMAKDLQKLGH